MREVKVFDYNLVINGEAVHITATKRGYSLITAAITANNPKKKTVKKN